MTDCGSVLHRHEDEDGLYCICQCPTCVAESHDR